VRDSDWDVELLDSKIPRVERTRGKEDNVIKTAQDKRTIVEEGTNLQGTLESECPILVNGRIDGDLRAPSIVVSATGSVQGVVQVGKIQSSGELCGQFDAEHVELTGAVKDNTVIRAKTLEMKLASKQGKMQVVFSQQDVPAAAAASERPPRGSGPPA
jgi:cytoskeletal protein CcmA (bactofilin family)